MRTPTAVSDRPVPVPGSGGGVRLPRLFLVAGSRRALIALGVLALAFGVAMLPAMATMTRHGASVIEFESASTVAESQGILDRWGGAGERAMWWQLLLDTPFVVCYGLLLAGGCAAVARRAHRAGRPRLERVGVTFAWLGAMAALADLAQNASLAVVLADPVSQPWPTISSLALPLTLALGAGSALFAIGGAIALRKAGPAAS